MSLVEPPSLIAPVTSNTQYCQRSYLQVTSTNTELKHTQNTAPYSLYSHYHSLLRLFIDSPSHT